MEDLEKRVLRRKRMSLTRGVNDVAALCDALHAKGLLSPPCHAAVLEDLCPERQVWHLVDGVLACQGDSPFQQFCDVLGHQNGALSRDLHADLEAEKGSMTLDEDVLREAGTLVHRKFGLNKRISAQDRKDIVTMVALKLQVAKEGWRDELEITRQELLRVCGRLDQYETHIADMNRMLKTHLQTQDQVLRTPGHDCCTPRDRVRNSVPDDDVARQLKVKVETAIRISKRLAEECDLLYNDKENCLAIFGLENGAPLAELIKTRLMILEEESATQNEEIKEKDSLIRKQQRRIERLQIKMEDRDNRMKSLEEQVKDLEARNEDQNIKMVRLQTEKEELSTKNAELQNTKWGYVHCRQLRYSKGSYRLPAITGARSQNAASSIILQNS